MQQRCSNCGSPVVPGQRFCGGCGAQLSLSCPQCRITVSPGTRFCPNCGSTLGGAPAQQPGWGPPGGGPPPQQPGWGQQPGMPPQQPGWGQQQSWTPTAPKSQSSSSRPFLVILLIVLLIGLGGLVYWQFGDQLLGFLKSSTGGTTTTDITKPVITDVKATVGADVVINWDTDVFASSQVEYGETTDYGQVYPAEPADDPTTGLLGVVTHSVTLPKDNLEQEVTYHFRVKSQNKAGETVSDDGTFTTLKPPE
jgi:hypothetical protein